MALVEINNVTREFEQGEFVVKALQGITLQIEAGEFTALVGPSGSGKTTLLNCIGALDLPTSGEIIIGGKHLSRMSKNELADFRLYELGFVFQAYNLIPVLTALENVEYTLLLQGIEKKERSRRAMSLFEEMGLNELAGRFPRELSGGQQQRVAVARALISGAKLVLADEPTANLDSENADKLLDIMSNLCDKMGVTFLFSTHDERVMRRARRLIRLRDGREEENLADAS